MSQKFLISFCLLFSQITAHAQAVFSDKIKVSDDIELIKISHNAYIHVSTFNFKNYGKVPCNGLLLIDGGKAFIVDSPVSNEQTETLVKFITDSLHASVTTFIPTHWHEDCMGGIDYIHSNGAKSYSNQMTIDLAKQKGLPPPQHGFKKSLHLKLNKKDVFCYFLGGGHSTDNFVVWFPTDKILFGGCLIKDTTSTGLGNLSDAAVEEWPATISKVMKKFPSVEVVIPGHGQAGGKELLLHTQKLLQQQK